jgi:hippurate hydrolase
MKNQSVLFSVALFGVLWAAGANAQQSLDQMVDRAIPSLLDTYKTLHANPELSHHEAKTAAFVAKELKSLGYDVTEQVGKYDDPKLTSYGVVAVLRNGKGPTVLVRTELDALPVEENTGLPYASKAKQINDVGKEVCVMHACGHDVHMTSLLGVARMLMQLKDQWRGTLVLVAQPAEETVDGARAMVNDELYSRFPRPDYAVAQHDSATLEAGKIGYCPEYAMASATSVNVTIRGMGGHGAAPEKTKDPVVVAAQFILALQTIVSRENSPLDPAVVTVGSIHGGTRPNIIPDEVELQLSVRTYKEEVRKKILASIERIAKNLALAAGIPEDRAPIVKIVEYTPATYNDPALTQRVVGVLENVIGAENVLRQPSMMGSEDFCCFGLEGRQIPICMFWLGAVDPAKAAKSKQTGVALPSLHSSLFAPLPEPTIRLGVKGMTSVVLDLMKK